MIVSENYFHRDGVHFRIQKEVIDGDGLGHRHYWIAAKIDGHEIRRPIPILDVNLYESRYEWDAVVRKAEDLCAEIIQQAKLDAEVRMGLGYIGPGA